MNTLNRTQTGLPTAYTNRILQFGAGHFLRAFVNWMVDVMNKEAGFDAGVIVVKPTPGGDYEDLRKQDGLFHLLTQGLLDGEAIEELRLISCIQGVLHPYLEWATFLATAQEPALNIIVSNTTEAGLQLDPSDQFDGQVPISFPAKLTCWLFERFRFFGGSADSGCILLPCELLPNNGALLQQLVVQCATDWQLPAAFSQWLRSHNHFCNTLVDRIVPGKPSQATVLQQITGYEDQLIVVAEPYHLWAIEGPSNLASILPFKDCQTPLNIVLTPDLNPYRSLKVRILNGLHSLMVPIGLVHGIHTVREMVEHPHWGSFLQNALVHEILPSLDFPSEVKEKYAATVFDRFKNPHIDHRLASIALNGLSKFRVRVLPSLMAHRDPNGQLPNYLLFGLACFIELYKGTYLALQDEDYALHYLKSAWVDYYAGQYTLEELVAKVLGNEQLWGYNLVDMQAAISAHLLSLQQRVGA